MGARQGIRWAGVLFAVLLVAASLVATMASCGSTSGGAKAASPSPKKGGTYNYPLEADPRPFYPALYATSPEVSHELYEGLVRWEEQPGGTLKTVPCLAESWSANADASVWTVRLRRGVMFQAPVSREVTAADVIADLRYLADPANRAEIAYQLVALKGTGKDGFADPASLEVKALDRYTVRFALKDPFSEFPDTLGEQAYWVWPKDYLQKVGLEAYGQHPVGTGPYQFRRWVTGKSLDLVPNPGWWDTSGGPYIDTIHYAILGNIPSTLFAFQKGLVDQTVLAQGQVPATRSLPQVKSGQWKVESSPLLILTYLCLDMKDPVLGGTPGLALRQALTYGCDRRSIPRYSEGVALPPSGIVAPGVPGSDIAQEPYPYDPVKARALLKQIGPITLDLIYPREQGGQGYRAQDIPQPLAASYAKVGITIKLRGLSQERFWPLWGEGKTQMVLMGWAADYPSMDNFLYLFESHNSGSSGLGTFYSNPKVDALLAKARATPDQATRVQRYADAEKIIMADAPVVPLYVHAACRLLNSRVANVSFNSMGWADMWRAWVK